MTRGHAPLAVLAVLCAVASGLLVLSATLLRDARRESAHHASAAVQCRDLLALEEEVGAVCLDVAWRCVTMPPLAVEVQR
jgi:hypothetical protein